VHSLKHSYRRSECLLFTAAEIEREGPQVPVCVPAVLYRTDLAPRMSQGFRLINVGCVGGRCLQNSFICRGGVRARCCMCMRGGGDMATARCRGPRRKIAKRDYSFVMSVCSCSMDVREIGYAGIFRIYLESFQVLLKSDTNNGYFT